MGLRKCSSRGECKKYSRPHVIEAKVPNGDSDGQYPGFPNRDRYGKYLNDIRSMLFRMDLDLCRAFRFSEKQN